MREIVTTDWDYSYNPYLIEFAENIRSNRDPFNVGLYHKRWSSIRKYGFAVPTYEAIATIDSCCIHPYADNIIEIGAGTGYWTYLLQQLNRRTRAFDPAPGGTTRSPYSFWKSWARVEKDDHTVLHRLPEAKSAVLVMIWPDYDVDWPAQALEAFPGQVLVYIGEGFGGCTGNERFHDILAKDWKAMDSKRIPQWPGIHDHLEIYRRKTEADRPQEVSL